MRLMIIENRKEIKSLKGSEKLVHLSFRPSYADIFKLIELCPNLKAIQIPVSYFVAISDSTRKFLDSKGISLLEGNLPMHRYSVKPYEIQPNKLKSDTRLGKGLVNFLLKEQEIEAKDIKAARS